uniref:Uncharacterized protein n=1 Tax=Ascaris lumbricoides TaxID=6252 RepID=A0A0M3I028_ASCLU
MANILNDLIPQEAAVYVKHCAQHESPQQFSMTQLLPTFPTKQRKHQCYRCI